MDLPKFIANVAGVFQEVVAGITSSAGALSANQLVATGADGKIDVSFLQSSEVMVMAAFEAISAGSFINVFNNGGTANIRKADATTIGKPCDGYVLETVAANGTVKVYFSGTNSAVTGVTAGPIYLSTTAGGFTSTPPSGSGNWVQQIGVGLTSTQIEFKTKVGFGLA